MTSALNHLLCDDCWKKASKTAGKPGRIPVRVQPDVGNCCACSALTTSGIYVREEPAAMPCKGLHVR